MENEVNLGTLYEINKAMMKTQQKLSSFEYATALNNIIKYFDKTRGYYMFLCREQYNYTLFKIKNENHSPQTAVTILQECIDNRGDILSIDYISETDAYEIWILNYQTQEPDCYYLFHYDEAIIEV